MKYLEYGGRKQRAVLLRPHNRTLNHLDKLAPRYYTGLWRIVCLVSIEGERIPVVRPRLPVAIYLTCARILMRHLNKFNWLRRQTPCCIATATDFLNALVACRGVWVLPNLFIAEFI
jgi:hypothetical protein